MYSDALLTSHAQDTYRAIWGFQILFVPERIPGMIQSMLADYREVSYSRLGGHSERC